MSAAPVPTWECYRRNQPGECPTDDAAGGPCGACRRFICAPAQPWTGDPGAPARTVRHAFAREQPGSQQNGWPGGDLVVMACLGCGVRWQQELPQ